MNGLGQFTGRFEEYILKSMDARGIPGLSVAVTDAERTRYLGTFGLSDISAAVPVSADTLFQIGSISKSFTALSLMTLVERGKADLHEPVKTYLPWFEVRSDHPPITLHHLLTHTASLPMGNESTMAYTGTSWTGTNLTWSFDESIDVPKDATMIRYKVIVNDSYSDDGSDAVKYSSNNWAEHGPKTLVVTDNDAPTINSYGIIQNVYWNTTGFFNISYDVVDNVNLSKVEVWYQYIADNDTGWPASWTYLSEVATPTA